MAFDDELHIVLTVDASGAVRAVRGFTGDLNRLERELDQVKTKTHNTFQAMDRRVRAWSEGFGGAFSAAMGPIKAFSAAVGAVGGALAAFAIDSSRRAADFDALTAAISAVEGSATTTAKVLKDLRRIAAGPGLGVTEAITTYLGLRRAGLDSAFSMRMTRELGNQVALSGGGKEVLGRVGLAVGQMATKPYLQGEELLQLTEAGLPAYQMVKRAFGTSDTEQLKKQGVTSQQVLAALLADMERAPRVMGGAKNAWENLIDAVDMARVSFGQGVNGGLLGGLNALSDQINEFTEAGVFRQLGENLIQGVADVFGDGDMRTALLEFTGAIDTAVIALRNLSLNVEGALDNLPGKPGNKRPWYAQTPIDWVADAYRWISDDSRHGGNQDWDPWDPYREGQSKRRAMEMQLELAEKRRERDERQAKRTRRRELTETPGSGPIHGVTDVPVMDGREVARLKQQTLLEKIEQNTRRAADVMDRILGGGVATQAAFNAVNLARWNDPESAILNAQRHNGGAVVAR